MHISKWYKEQSFWDLVAWGCLAFIFVWLILKSVGVINTPELVRMAPYFAGVFLAGRLFEKLNNVEKELKSLKHTVKRNHNEFKHLEMTLLSNNFRALKKKIKSC